MDLWKWRPGKWQFQTSKGVVPNRGGRNSVVECQLPKLDVVGSNPIARSIFYLWSSLSLRGLARVGPCVGRKYGILPKAPTERFGIGMKSPKHMPRHGGSRSVREIHLTREVLWAPWRLDYILANKDNPDGGCFICRGLAAQSDRENLVLWRGRLSVVVLNRFPYNNGHLLVAPVAHKGALAELTDDELLELMQTQRRMMDLLDQVLQPHGFNVGLNLGRVAGAGLPGHLHWHVVPRWNGDTNFMPVVSDTRVIVQSLESLYDLMKESLG